MSSVGFSPRSPYWYQPQNSIRNSLKRPCIKNNCWSALYMSNLVTNQYYSVGKTGNRRGVDKRWKVKFPNGTRRFSCRQLQYRTHLGDSLHRYASRKGYNLQQGSSDGISINRCRYIGANARSTNGCSILDM